MRCVVYQDRVEVGDRNISPAGFAKIAMLRGVQCSGPESK